MECCLVGTGAYCLTSSSSSVAWEVSGCFPDEGGLLLMVSPSSSSCPLGPPPAPPPIPPIPFMSMPMRNPKTYSVICHLVQRKILQVLVSYRDETCREWVQYTASSRVFCSLWVGDLLSCQHYIYIYSMSPAGLSREQMHWRERTVAHLHYPWIR